MKTVQMQKVKLAISEMSMAELRQISEYINMTYKMQSRQATKAFSVGDKVQFTHPSQGTIKATVKKVNSKTVSVVATNGTPWNVSGSLLKAI